MIFKPIVITNQL